MAVTPPLVVNSVDTFVMDAFLETVKELQETIFAPKGEVAQLKEEVNINNKWKFWPPLWLFVICASIHSLLAHYDRLTQQVIPSSTVRSVLPSVISTSIFYWSLSGFGVFGLLTG